jgi:hypothetical protein
MSIGAVGGSGAAISIWPSLGYLEAQLLRDQRQLWAHQSATAEQSIINADLLAIQHDKLAIARNNFRSAPAPTAAQFQTAAQSQAATQARASSQAGLLTAVQNSKLARLVGTKITNQASYLIPASFTLKANNQSAAWSLIDLYL